MASERQSMQFGDMIAIVEAQHTTVQGKLDQIKARQSSVSIGDMFEMQMLMNRLSQLCEMSTALASAMHSATYAVARNVRGG